ncbi:Ketoreductase azaE [Vanrija pseudolonga]|uniref:Ketoreductase azaE n=1 Tax=Vanrija pseudolonga TaxID=143232 RepID=A0AAF1BL26_9TREE|nr:Ketoreductase azaE [Vanrija pseudolonga]
MPVPPKSSLVLVTGANGYIASWVTLYLLQQGYSVRGTTRNDAKGQWMKEMYKDRGLDNFDYVVVADLENDNAFDEAVKGVDAIIHTASPFHWNITKPDDLIKPAVAGTVSALKAASKEPKVQRVVITSSYASILENRDPPGSATFNEDDWNEQSIREVDEKGLDALRTHWYRASKTLAERAAWDYVKKETPSFDVVTICPPYVLGPIIHEAASPETLNTSVGDWYKYLTGEKTTADATAPAGVLCDVRDVADVHVKALLQPEAAGKRFGIATRTFTHQILLDHVNADPKLAQAFPHAVRGVPGQAVPPINIYDTSRSHKALGIEPRDEGKTAVDMTESLRERKVKWDAAAGQ